MCTVSSLNNSVTVYSQFTYLLSKFSLLVIQVVEGFIVYIR